MRAEEGLRQTLEPAHIQLLSQISKLPGGVKNIVDMRCDLLVRAVYEISENFELRTVPTIVIAHTFCASSDTRISYHQCLLIQGYFCAV